MIRLLILMLLSTLPGCDKPKTVTMQEESSRPKVPSLLAVSQPARSELLVALHTDDAKKDYSDVLSHPWVQQQKGLTHVSKAMVEDIRSLRDASEAINKYRAKSGMSPVSFDDENKHIITAIEAIQEPLTSLNLKFPSDRYSVLNIPPVSPDLYKTPLPFQVYKRVELGETDLGTPLYMDVRVFDISSLKGAIAKNAAIDAVIDWHVHLLQKGEEKFRILKGKDVLALTGEGDRDTSHFDGGHGFAANDRAVFLAFLTDGDRLYVFHADGPRKNLEDKKVVFLDILNRPLFPWDKRLQDYKLIPENNR
ncbi:MAG: hypothetical protein Q8K75_03705 [Chlamydiales bacterium]|nr:hypothetical protein [Chlamydiales bacterium]